LDVKKRLRPPSYGGLVPRRWLVRRLIASREVSLVLIAAPAGYGKTSLLSEWAQADERPFAWVTLDRGDDDVGHLLMAIIHAIAEIEPLAQGVANALAAPISGIADSVLLRLASSLESRRRPLVIVLDNAHVLEAPAALNALSTIADHLPPGSQLVLGSRGMPALPIGRLRAHHRLVELHAADLAMTVPEAAALLQAAGLSLDTEQVLTLVRRTEGWPVALYLAALSLRDEPDTPAAVACFGGEDEIVSDYLREELIAGLPTEAVTFLMRSSILEELWGSVCDAVLERSDTALLLQDLARRNLLLVPLDRTGESYRCHGLLREMLQRELRRHDPDLIAGLHRRAGIWHAAHGDVDGAIDHALAANDPQRGGELLWAHILRYIAQGRNETVQRWLGGFTEEQIAADAALSLCAAHSHLAKGDLELAEHWGSVAAAALERSPHASEMESLTAGVALIDAAVARHGVVRMGQDAARAYELESEHSPWRTVCCLYRGVACHLAGDTDSARRLLQEGVHRSAALAPTIEALCLAQLAIIALEEGDWELAGDRCAQASTLVERRRLGDHPTSALLFAVPALVCAQAGRADEAKELLRASTRLLEMLDGFVAWYELETRVMLARASARLTDILRARTLLAEASRAGRRMSAAPALKRWLDEAWEELDSRAAVALDGSSSLTLAELRILRFLPTHLSFREIGDRLHVSTNTVKSQAHAVYRKLDACSRSEAVAHASRVGLIWNVSM
jgi:LuxR family transcriptional regulator, maltose regulon positive regulatory protein